MITRHLLGGLLAVGIFLGSSGVAMAQRPAHYVPVKPPISPYFMYSEINTTGLPNYYTYLLPAQQYRNFVSKTDPNFARFEERITLAGDRVEQLIERQLELRQTTGVGAPAAPATFMELSHFYNKPVGRKRR